MASNRSTQTLHIPSINEEEDEEEEVERRRKTVDNRKARIEVKKKGKAT